MLGVDWNSWLRRKGVRVKMSTINGWRRTHSNCVEFAQHVHRFSFEWKGWGNNKSTRNINKWIMRTKQTASKHTSWLWADRYICMEPSRVHLKWSSMLTTTTARCTLQKQFFYYNLFACKTNMEITSLPSRTYFLHFIRFVPCDIISYIER